jgi:hypothetical protein
MQQPSDGATGAAALLHPHAKQRLNAAVVPAVGKFAPLAGIDRSPHATQMTVLAAQARAGESRRSIGENSENFLKLCGVF